MSLLILPKKEIDIIIPTKVGMKGLIRVQTINKYSGKITSDTGFFPNTILNSGLNQMATNSSWMNYCQVGSGNTFPESVEDRRTETSLEIWVAGTNNIEETTYNQSGVAPYYGWKRKRFRFASGDAAGNLNEVGIGWGNSGSTLISRAQILNPQTGLPTTVTPLPDELLDVTYELRYYVPTEDVIGPQVTLDGTTYNTITRAAYATSAFWSQYIGQQIGPVKSRTYWDAWTGTLGEIYEGPNGVQSNTDNDSQWNSGYVGNSYQIAINCFAGASGWNAVGGIRTIRASTTAGYYQTQFTSTVDDISGIPKTSSYNMTMSWMLSWEEHV